MSLGTDELPFKLGQENGHAVVQAPARLRLLIRYEEGASNTAEYAQLFCFIYQFGKLGVFGDRTSARKREETIYWPYFIESEKVVWSSSKDRHTLESTDSVIEHLVDTLSRLVEAETT